MYHQCLIFFLTKAIADINTVGSCPGNASGFGVMEPLGTPTQKQMAHSNGPEASPSPERFLRRTILRKSLANTLLVQLQDPTQSFLSNTAWKCSFRKAYFQEAKILQGAPNGYKMVPIACLQTSLNGLFLGVTRLPFAEMPIFFSQFRTSAAGSHALLRVLHPPTIHESRVGDTQK